MMICLLRLKIRFCSEIKETIPVHCSCLKRKPSLVLPRYLDIDSCDYCWSVCFEKKNVERKELRTCTRYLKVFLPLRWHSRLDRSPRIQRVGSSNSCRDRHESKKQVHVLIAPLPNIRQHV